jgi:hypothetical protein
MDPLNHMWSDWDIQNSCLSRPPFRAIVNSATMSVMIEFRKRPYRCLILSLVCFTVRTSRDDANPAGDSTAIEQKTEAYPSHHEIMNSLT